MRHPTKTTRRRRRRPTRAAIDAHLSPPSLANWARPEPGGSGPDRSRRQPRPAPGMRSVARARPPGEEAAASRRTDPPATAGPPPPTACPSVLRLGGRPPPPGTHRYQRGRLPAASPPQARRDRLGFAHLPAVGQRRHQPTSAGTRQWRPGRSVEVVGAEGAHAAAATAVT